MFDQNWLKRYMLANRPGGPEDGGGGPRKPSSPPNWGPEDAGGGPAKSRSLPLPETSPEAVREMPKRLNTPPSLLAAPAVAEDRASEASVHEVTCQRCGNVYKSDAPYCRKCGHRRLEARMSDAAARQSRPPGPPPPTYATAPPEAFLRQEGGNSRRISGASEHPSAAMSASPMGYANNRYFAPSPPSDKYYRSDAMPPQSPLVSNIAANSPPPANYAAVASGASGQGTAVNEAPPSVLSGMAPPGPPSAQMPWPPMSPGNFYGSPYGNQPSFENNANMFNPVWGYGGYGGEGAGAKNFVVICKDDVEIRASPTYADDARIGHFLHPGQVVVIDDRRMVGGSWFLHLADGRGWVFETKDRLLVMTEVHEFERGLWHYSVVCDDDVETRLSPTYSDDARTGMLLGSGDCIAVDERCRVAGARFLKLADGRGWVFESMGRLLVFSEVRSKPQEARDFERGLWHYTVVCDDDVEIRAAPTYSDEARTGLMVHPGDCVAIDERCRVAAVWFLRLSDGRGWVFESKDSRRVMMQLH
mmetsp:Transcript_26759/g.48777  ORF Transcript_26759/g.48777 Transcript_26759/m.48777 type:complete len:531 (-) Transcript_26759:37-1629(-)